MLPGRGSDQTEVTCIACGDRVARSDAREYDKHGDRWDRRGKEFEYLCKPCHRDLCHQPREELGRLLDDIETGGLSRDRFLARFTELTEGERDPPESAE